MAILDSIKAAEEQARSIKTSATASAREYLREVESKANVEAEELIAKARTTAREKVAAAENESKIRLQELLAERDTQNKVLAEQSAERIKKVADFLVGKVVN